MSYTDYKPTHFEQKTIGHYLGYYEFSDCELQAKYNVCHVYDF